MIIQYLEDREKGKEGPKETRGLRNVLALGIVSLFTDISSEMVFGLLPVFLTSQVGISRTLLGLIEGTGEMLGHTVRLGSGVASDRLQARKSLVLLGYSLSAAAKPLFAFTGGAMDALAIRSLERSGKGIRTAPRDALISESVQSGHIGRAFGVHRSLDQVGGIIGPAIAFALFPLFGFSGVFYLSIIPAAVAVLILIFFVRESKKIRGRSLAPSDRPSISSNMKSVLREKNFMILLSLMAFFSVGAFNFSFILVGALDKGVELQFVPIIYVVLNIAHTALGFPAGILADRIGREKVLAMGYGIFGLSVGIMVLGQTPIYAYSAAVAFGTYLGITETVQRALIPKYVSKESLRGTAYGIYNFVIGVCFLAANIIFGFLVDSSGLIAAATYSMVISGISVATILVFQAFGKRAQPNHPSDI